MATKRVGRKAARKKQRSGAVVGNPEEARSEANVGDATVGVATLDVAVAPR